MTLPPQDSAVPYMSPTYLRTPMREYLSRHDTGIYWLRAPSDLGKTQFVRGIIERRPSAKEPGAMEGIDSNLASDLRSIGFYIRKDAPDGPRQLVDALSAAFAAEFGLGDEERSRLAPSIRYTDAAEARADFLAWLKLLHETVVAKGIRRLLVCVDALDAMTEPGSGAFAETFPILDLLPAVSELPPGVVLAVTSRPADACPAGLLDRITQRFGSGADYAVRDVTFEDKEYVELLQKYYREKVRLWFRARATKHLDQMLGNKGKFTRAGRDGRLNQDTLFRDGLKDDWKKLTNKYPRYGGEPLPVASITGILDEIDKLWTDLTDKTEHRFRLVSLLVARLVDGALPLEQVAELPKGDELLAKLEAMPAKAAA
jgi:hypothetical protein